MTDNPAKAFNFIKDEAATTDKFGSHSRVAKAVASVIHGDPFLKVVGLIGPWGSGKSTALKLIQKEMATLDSSTKTKTHFFVYDAWNHQNDPPRRSFLEMLVRFLEAKDPSRKGRWALELDRLNRQVEDNETIVTPTLTLSGRVLLFVFALVPIGFLFAGHDWLREKIPVPLIGEITVFCLGLSLILGPPLAAAAGMFIYYRTTWKLWTRRFWTASRFEGESVLAMFMNKEVTRSRHRVIRSPDPTSIEFQKLFREIMESVFDPAQKFVFVVDNLDRLSGKDAIPLWATIRSFFLGATDDAKPETAQFLPIVLLPIDPTALERQYAETEQADAMTLAASFMDKTFDLTFYINRPVPSDWVSYLDEQMKSVFGGQCTDQWVLIVRRLYEEFAENPERLTGPNAGAVTITPRKINALVNAIALLKLQWQEELPFATLAFYAINREGISVDVLRAIRAPQPFLSEQDPAWASGVAAIYYGVPRQTALQVTLRDPLIEAIRGLEQSKFTEYAAIPGSQIALENAVDMGSRAQDSDLQFIAKAAIVLDGQGFADSATMSALWTTLRRRVATSQGQPGFPDFLGAGLALLIAKCPERELPQFCDAVGFALSNLGPQLANQTPVDSWPKVVSIVFDAAQKRGQILSTLTVKGGAANFLHNVGTVMDKPTLAGALNPDASDGDVLSQIEGWLAEPTFDSERTVKFLQSAKPQWSWEPFAIQLAKYVHEKPGSERGTGVALVCLGQMRRAGSGRAAEQLDLLNQSGVVLQRLGETVSTGDVMLEVPWIAAQLSDPESFENANRAGIASLGMQEIARLPGRAASNSQFISAVCERIADFGPAQYLARLVASTPTSPELLPAVRLIFEWRIDQNMFAELTPAVVGQKIPLFLSCLDENRQLKFLRSLAGMPGLWEQVAALPGNEDVFRILEMLFPGSDSIATAAQFALIARLKLLNEDAWRQVYLSGADPSLLLGRLKSQHHHPFDLGHALFSVLYDDLPDLAVRDAEQTTRWFSLSENISASNRTTLFKGVRDALFASADLGQMFDLLAEGGADLLKVGRFGDEADRAARQIVFRGMDEVTYHSWLLANSGEVRIWVERATQETRDSIQDRFQSVFLAAPDETARAALDFLANSIGLRAGVIAQPDDRESQD